MWRDVFEKPARPAYEGHRSPCPRTATGNLHGQKDKDHSDEPRRHDRDYDDQVVEVSAEIPQLQLVEKALFSQRS